MRIREKEQRKKTYRLNDFDPKKTDSALSYTPTRLAKAVFNTYDENDDFAVLCYLTDWSIYDERLAPINEDSFKIKGGRGADLMRFKGDKENGKPFKRIIFSFAGIIGDPGSKGEGIIEQAIKGWKMGEDKDEILKNYKGRPILVDPWGDVAAYLNCGFSSWKDETWNLYDGNKAQGVLGGLRLLKEANSDLEISVSVGGWSMSGAFYEVCRNDIFRQRFIDGIKDLFDKFPILTHIDLDWEYPGSAGDGNPNAPDDYEHFVELIKDLKNANISNLKSISIAASADIEKN
ncbi:glycosyl hydrolase family 18 protein [Photorhabdus temperata]|uniref:glycosyl hydrolase family 18 protein n=1 Tax=Photorhabdus temperata TaxID=574560 RepID=UPI0030839281